MTQETHVSPETSPSTGQPAGEAAVPDVDAALAAAGYAPIEEGDEIAATLAQAATEDLQARVVALEAEVATVRGDYLRALAESQNAQSRADRRIESNTKYAIANIAKDLIAVADNLQRALQHVPPEAREKNEMLNGLATGVEMTEKALHDVLERNGVTRITSLQQPFDPNLHQGVQEIQDATVPTGTVVQVLQEGYLLRDRLVRPAMVVVSRGGPKRQAVPSPEAPPPEPLPEKAPETGGESGQHIDTSV